MKYFYTYVLKCSDGELYCGSADDLRRRLREHGAGQVESTRFRLSADLVYFEGCLSLDAARKRERQLKTGFGRAYLKRRLKSQPGG